MFPLPPSEGVYDGKRDMRKAEQREGNCSWRHLASMNNQVSSKKKDKITKRRYYITYRIDKTSRGVSLYRSCHPVG